MFLLGYLHFFEHNQHMDNPLFENATPLILASTSIYRRELLSKLGIPFHFQKPLFDEEKEKNINMSPQDWVSHLGREKARSLSSNLNCTVGGDQMVLLGNEILGKPGHRDQSLLQLSKMQGKTHELLTAVSVFYKGTERSFLNTTKMTMRKLSTSELESYVDLEKPFDCAGSYKIEKHGIILFEKIETTDFTAIQGLPLLELTQVLLDFGYKIPHSN